MEKLAKDFVHLETRIADFQIDAKAAVPTSVYDTSKWDTQLLLFDNIVESLKKLSKDAVLNSRKKIALKDFVSSCAKLIPALEEHVGVEDHKVLAKVLSIIMEQLSANNKAVKESARLSQSLAIKERR